MLVERTDTRQAVLEIVGRAGARGITARAFASQWPTARRTSAHIGGAASLLSRLWSDGFLAKSGEGRFARFAVTQKGVELLDIAPTWRAAVVEPIQPAPAWWTPR